MAEFKQKLGAQMGVIERIEYVLVATKPDASQVFWTWTGFSRYEERAARMISLDFADTTFGIERTAHPDWKFDLRVYGSQPRPRYKQKLGAPMGVIQPAEEFIDECGPLPECHRCGLAVGVCECAEIEQCISCLADVRDCTCKL